LRLNHTTPTPTPGLLLSQAKEVAVGVADRVAEHPIALATRGEISAMRCPERHGPGWNANASLWTHNPLGGARCATIPPIADSGRAHHCSFGKFEFPASAVERGSLAAGYACAGP